MRRFIPRLIAQLFCAAFVFLLASECSAQLPVKPNSSTDPTYRELELQNLRRDPKQVSTREQMLAQLAVREDFRNLQLVNNDMMKRRFLGAPDTISLKEIRGSLEKIKTLAKRLRTNLAIPETGADKDCSKTPCEYKVTLSPGLLLLDTAVMNFVNNPMFQQPRVFDPELAGRAEKDLGEIVRLSEFLRPLTKENLSVARR